MAAYEDDIDRRREKLRSMILTEEAAVTREIVDQARHAGEGRLDEMQDHMDELRRKREEEHQEVVAAKRMQQYLARCVDFRDYHSKWIAENVKRCNLAQIAEKAARREEERKLDALWHQLMLKEVEVAKQRESNEARRQKYTTKMIRESLDNQIRAQKAQASQTKSEQREELEGMWENIRINEQLRLERENRRRAQLKKDLEDQMIQKQKNLAEEAAEEKAEGQMLKQLGDDEMEKERMKRSQTARLRGEMLAYLSSLEALREDEARRSVEVDMIVEESRKSAKVRWALATQKFKEARARGLRDVLEGREKQLQEKREAEARGKAEIEEEALTGVNELEIHEKKLECEEKEKRDRAKAYGQELKDQQRYREAVRCRKKEEVENMYRDGLKKEQEYQQLTKVLLEASEDVTPHPFRVLLKESDARRAAEREGQCYCPPSLPQT